MKQLNPRETACAWLDPVQTARNSTQLLIEIGLSYRIFGVFHLFSEFPEGLPKSLHPENTSRDGTDAAWSKRLASELNQLVVERTAKLATAGDEMTGEIVERRNIRQHLLEREATPCTNPVPAAHSAAAGVPIARRFQTNVARNFANWRNFASQGSAKF